MILVKKISSINLLNINIKFSFYPTKYLHVITWTFKISLNTALVCTKVWSKIKTKQTVSYRRFVISQNRHQALPYFQSIFETPAASVALDNIKDIYNFMRSRKYFSKSLEFYKKIASLHFGITYDKASSFFFLRLASLKIVCRTEHNLEHCLSRVLLWSNYKHICWRVRRPHISNKWRQTPYFGVNFTDTSCVYS